MVSQVTVSRPSVREQTTDMQDDMTFLHTTPYHISYLPMSSLTHSIPCPASDRCDTGDVSVPPPRRSAPVFVCFIATQEFNVVQSNRIYNLKSFYTCIKSSVVRAPGRYQAFFWVLIDLIIGFLGLIIKAFDNQTEIWA
jgi:hypothetical protein